MAFVAPLVAVLRTAVSLSENASARKERKQGRIEAAKSTADALRVEQLALDRSDRVRRRSAAGRGGGQTLLGGNLETPAEIGARHFGHYVISNHQIELVVLGEFPCLTSVAADRNIKSCRFELEANRLRVSQGILRQQDFGA